MKYVDAVDLGYTCSNMNAISIIGGIVLIIIAGIVIFKIRLKRPKKGE